MPPLCHTGTPWAIALILGAQLLRVGPAGAVEDIEFVAEHLPEVAMDNRYATLPVWVGDSDKQWTFSGQAAYAQTATGELEVKGPFLSIAATRQWRNGWDFGAAVFFDDLQLDGDNDYRPLQTLFAPSTPLTRPADARFDNLDGSMRHIGVSFSIGKSKVTPRMGAHRWVAGAIVERIELTDYRLDYEILAGPDAGTTGTIDFDATYRHVTPFFGLELPRIYDRWSYDVTALFALPLPRRGFVGHITGPGFDIHGDTEEVGNGKHFGDPSLTLGFDVTYQPAHLTIGLGTLVTQRLLEPLIHKGIETNWVLNLRVSY